MTKVIAMSSMYYFLGHTVVYICVVYECCLVYYRVLVLESGRVREFDSPATLLSNRNSQFYSLAKNAGLV